MTVMTISVGSKVTVEIFYDRVQCSVNSSMLSYGSSSGTSY